MQQAPADYPPAYVPVSGWAISALVLSIVLALPAMMLVYWPQALPLVIVFLSWGQISSRRRRGMGIAIAAGVISLLAGVYGFAMSKAAAEIVQTLMEPLLKGAESGDVSVARRWVLSTEDAAERAAAWKTRFAAAQTSVGKWNGRVEVGSFWTGPMGMVAPPTGVEEVDPKGEGSVGLGSAVWIRAMTDQGPIWAALQGKADESGHAIEEMSKRAGREDSKALPEPKALKDLRFFVPTGKASPKKDPR